MKFVGRTRTNKSEDRQTVQKRKMSQKQILIHKTLYRKPESETINGTVS
jgi:hypothetical protein